MPSQRYEPVSQFDETPNNSYFTGLPSTALPSFHSVDLPHRNDESAATVIPPSERSRMGAVNVTDGLDDGAISLWGSSEGGGVRELENAVVRLTERLEVLEERGLVNKVETDMESQLVRNEGYRWSKADIIGTVLGMLFGVWICGIVTLSVMTAYRRAGVRNQSS